MNMRSQTQLEAASGLPFMPARFSVLQRKCACGEASGLTDKCVECDKRRLSLKGKPEQRADVAVPDIVHDVLRSPGTPLDATTRVLMESRLGHNFSRVAVDGQRLQDSSLAVGAAGDQYERKADASAAGVDSATSPGAGPADFNGVRLHTDRRAAESAQAVGARAYTVGSHVVFGTGRFAPHTGEGRSLLAHELTHVLQQTGGGSAVLQRQPDKGEEPAVKTVGCDKDRVSVVEEAIKTAGALATRAVQAFEREYAMTAEAAAMRAHFGPLSSDQKATIIARYKHVIENLARKTYTCAKDNRRVREGTDVVDTCGQAACPGSAITLYPVFGSKTCPAGPVMLHEAIHNAGACNDVNKGNARYPPSSSEDNAYSYEYFALDVAAGYKTPELGKRRPNVPRVKD